MASISKNVLENSSESGYAFLSLILREVRLVLHHWEWCLLWICHIWLYYFEIDSLYAHFLESFIIWMLHFVKSIYWNDNFIYILQLVNMTYQFDLSILKNPCNPETNPTWSWCMILLKYCGIFLLVFCWQVLHLYSSMILAYNFLFFVISLSCLVIKWWWPYGMSLGVLQSLQ